MGNTADLCNIEYLGSIDFDAEQYTWRSAPPHRVTTYHYRPHGKAWRRVPWWQYVLLRRLLDAGEMIAKVE